MSENDEIYCCRTQIDDVVVADSGLHWYDGYLISLIFLLQAAGSPGCALPIPASCTAQPKLKLERALL